MNVHVRVRQIEGRPRLVTYFAMPEPKPGERTFVPNPRTQRAPRYHLLDDSDNNITAQIRTKQDQGE